MVHNAAQAPSQKTPSPNVLLDLWHEALARNGKTRSIILASTFRSGSSYVASLLRANGVVGLGQETFAQAWRLSAKGAGPEDAEAFFGEVAANGEGPCLASKLMWPHRTHFAGALGLGREQASAFADLFPAARWIHVERRDKIEQAVSFWRAKRSGRWHVYGRGEPEPPVTYSFRDLLGALREIELHDRLWADFFATAGIQPIPVTYETLIQDVEGGLTDVLRRLDALGESGVVTQVNLKRQADDLSTEFRERFLEDLYRGVDAGVRTDLQTLQPNPATPKRLQGREVDQGARPASVPKDMRDKIRAALSGLRREPVEAAGPSVQERLETLEGLTRQIRQLVGPFGLPLGAGHTLVQSLHQVKYLVPADDLVMTPSLVVYRQWDPVLSALMPRLCPPGSTFVDVGASFGYFSCLAAVHMGTAPGSRVIAIEPNPDLVDLLTRNRELNWSTSPMRIVETAAGALSGEGTFQSLPSRPNGGTLAELGPNAPEPLTRTVQIATLDDILTDEPDPTLIKIDAEGLECAVLGGAEQTLPRVTRGLAITWDPDRLRMGGFRPMISLMRLADMGYSLHRLPAKTEDPLPDPESPKALAAVKRCRILALRGPL